MSLVIDCSALVDLWVASDQEVVQEAVGESALHAPAHVDVEVVSALRGLVFDGHLSRTRAQDALLDLEDLTIHRWPLEHPMALAALAFADNVTAYDAAYVVLAQALECPLITRDRRLARAVGQIVEVQTAPRRRPAPCTDSSSLGWKRPASTSR